MGDYIYPTKEEQLPSFRVFILDIIREKQPTTTPEGQEFYRYLGIQIYCPDKRVIKFHTNEQYNLGEYFAAQAWVEKEMNFLNSFWDVDDYRYIITTDVVELLQIINKNMMIVGEDIIRQKNMLN